MQQFLVAAVVGSLVWYAGVFLWFSSRRGGGGLRAGGSGRVGALSSVSEVGRVGWGEGDFDGDDLMGKVRLPQGMEVISSAELRFAAAGDGSGAGSGMSKSDQLGLIPDVLEEIKEVFGILAREDGTKQDFIGLMKLVREKYPRISSHPGLSGLNAFIRDHASFHISSEELEDLWD